MKRKPGFAWRVLAHRVEGASVDVVSEANHRASERWWRKAMPGKARPTAGREQVIAEPSVFDELVVDDWFHIEQMDTRLWWMRIGNADGKSLVVWVRIPSKGDAVVTSYEE